MATRSHLFTCPMCGEIAEDGVAFRDHLAAVHDLVDDPGTDTVATLQTLEAPTDVIGEETSEQPPPARDAEPSPSPEGRTARAPRASRPAREPRVREPRVREPRRAREPRPARTPRAPREPRTSRLWTRRTGPLALPPAQPGDRYPLALRYGDIALYGPGVVLLVVGLTENAVALTVTGVFLAVLGMLLPVVHVLGVPTPSIPPRPAAGTEPGSSEPPVAADAPGPGSPPAEKDVLQAEA